MSNYLDGPPIDELLNEATKLVKLEPRLDNRHIRRDSYSTQMEHQRNHVLDLLSPLSMEDVKTQPVTNGSYESKSNLTRSLKEKPKQTECHNCKTHTTPLWRKDPQGNTLCNACGLFLKLHGTTRPLSLKTDVIKKRSSRRSTNSKSSTNLQMERNKQSLAIPAPPMSVMEPAPPVSTSLPTSGSRYKNILILPKPQQKQSAIPIPSTGSSPQTPNAYNQPFKRKKSEVNISKMSSFNRRSSTNLARKNSVYHSNHTTPSSSLTSNNISILNSQKFGANTFFDNPVKVEGTPGSVTSASSFGRQPSFTAIPQEFNKGRSPRYEVSTPNTPLNIDMMTNKRPGPQESYPQNSGFMRGIDDEMLMDTDITTGFYPQFSTGQDFMDTLGTMSSPPPSELVDDHEIQSSLTRGLTMGDINKDLDWLRFEL
ncbi:hypothetical protein DICA3_B02916 [Diutina catenulata]